MFALSPSGFNRADRGKTGIELTISRKLEADPMEHTAAEAHHRGYLTLITAGDNETVPNGVP